MMRDRERENHAIVFWKILPVFILLIILNACGNKGASSVEPAGNSLSGPPPAINPSPFVIQPPTVNGFQNIWSATSTLSAPTSRFSHTAVWTGSKMIIWGGDTGSANNPNPTNTGGIYDPAADTWSPLSTTDAPDAREFHTAVWTGSKMIVWGGIDPNNTAPFNTGGIYDSALDTWSPVSATNVPAARFDHTAVWTGSRMIVWGGNTGDGGNPKPANTGGIYNPVVDTWSSTSASGAPSGRELHTAVWTGSRMIVWGGLATFNLIPTNTGGIFDPTANNWFSMSITNAPSARGSHTAVWTGSKMVVWGGSNPITQTAENTGGRFQ
jgi:hypothetical protein